MTSFNLSGWCVVKQFSSVFFRPCSDGVGRTGTFICIHAQLERLKTEGVVDFFQSIKSARIQRAGLVPDVVSVMILPLED